MVATQQKDLLTLTERELIAKVVNHNDSTNPVSANQIISIRYAGDVVWVQLFKYWATFERDWFHSQIPQLKLKHEQPQSWYNSLTKRSSQLAA